MPGKIDIAVNPDKHSLNLTLSTEAGASQSLTLSTAEVNQLLQTLGEVRMAMAPMRQPKPGPTDRFQGTTNPPVQLFPGTKEDAILLLFLDIRYGLLGFEFQNDKWNELVKQVADFLAAPRS
jgi:hypothetical protein